MANKTPLADYSGKLKELAGGDLIPIASLASGTPTGSKFIRDDGVLAVPSGGSGGITWTEETTTARALAVNTGTIANNASQVVGTLPSTAALGSIIRMAGSGAGGWKIAQNLGQTIRFGRLTTTSGTGGSLASTQINDAVELLCITANTVFQVISSNGNITVV